MKQVEVKLERLTICPCGYSVLRDEIQVGTKYTIDMDTLSGGFAYKCGACGEVFTNVQAVKASQHLQPHLPMRYLPYDLFTRPQ